MTCDHEVTKNKATKLEGNNNAMSNLWRMIDRDKTLNSIHYEYLRILLFCYHAPFAVVSLIKLKNKPVAATTSVAVGMQR